MSNTPPVPIQVLGSRDLPAWLAERDVSLAFTTYQTGKIFLIGRKPDGSLAAFERTFNRAMGMTATAQTLWLATAYQLWRFENILADGQLDQGFDRLYVPRVGYTTGDIDIHDVSVADTGRVVFSATRFSCLATMSERDGFRPLWRPAFVSKMAPEDRCHLNGLALVAGQPRYVTACARSDVVAGWRARRHDGGCVIDVIDGQVLCEGLSMPHSPRWHEDRLWLLDSGHGYLGRLDIDNRTFEPLAFCPGYARGLAFAGNHAVVGVSRPRHEGTFRGLPLDDELRKRGGEAKCGLLIVDLASGNVTHWLWLEGVDELYDVAVLPGVTRPTLLGFKSDEIRYTVTAEGHPGVIWRGVAKE
ncbi:MAG: TIGR03032 family protein [Planctomycetes bacterium]|nr:TIGR03032 family protein [Planctomycetota bacterium]